MHEKSENPTPIIDRWLSKVILIKRVNQGTNPVVEKKTFGTNNDVI